jgi:hypothetical protein
MLVSTAILLPDNSRKWMRDDAFGHLCCINRFKPLIPIACLFMISTYHKKTLFYSILFLGVRLGLRLGLRPQTTQCYIPCWWWGCAPKRRSAIYRAGVVVRWWCGAVLCCAVLCCAVLCCGVRCCAVLWCAVLCGAVRCCAVRCCGAVVRVLWCADDVIYVC